jgi:uncharacterized membrane protein
MDDVLQYRIPELHPLIVHFPLTLLLTAACTAIVWMWRGTAFWRGVTLLLVALGAVSGYFAFITGESMEDQAEGVPIVEELVDLHHAMAIYTLSAACAATLLIGVQAWRMCRKRSEKDPPAARIVIGLLIIVAGALVAWTGHIGATMVWGVAP